MKKQSKNSGIRAGLIPVSETPLISEILNILSESHELNEKIKSAGRGTAGRKWLLKTCNNWTSEKQILSRGACNNRMWNSVTKRCLPVSGSYRLCWFMFLGNYLADDEKSKEILPEHTMVILSGARERELRGEPGMWEWHRAGTWESWDHPSVLPSQPSQFSPWFLTSLNKVQRTKLPNSVFLTALERFFSSPLWKGFLCSQFFCINSMLFMLECLNSFNISPGLEEAPSVLNKRSQVATALNKV